jgi:hypothetical protein
MPNIYFETLEAVPEGLRPHAKTDEEGKIAVNVVPESKLSEFRDKNIQLSKDNEDLGQKVTFLHAIVGDDPDAFKSDIEDMKTVRQRVKDGELKEGRQIEEAIAKRTEEMSKGYKDQLQNESKEKALWRQKFEAEAARFKEQVVVSAVKDACMDPELGVNPHAVRDITQRAKEVFRVGEDGKLTAYNGDAMIYGADGASSVTPREWAAKLKEEAPHFFKGSGGGGAGGERGANPGDRKVVGAHTRADLSKMSPRDRLAAANEEPGLKF